MYGIIGIIAGFIAYKIICYLKIKGNKVGYVYDSENKCWIPNDDLTQKGMME